MLSAFLTYNVKPLTHTQKGRNPFHFKNTNQFTHKATLSAACHFRLNTIPLATNEFCLYEKLLMLRNYNAGKCPCKLSHEGDQKGFFIKRTCYLSFTLHCNSCLLKETFSSDEMSPKCKGVHLVGFLCLLVCVFSPVCFYYGFWTNS